MPEKISGRMALISPSYGRFTDETGLPYMKGLLTEKVVNISDELSASIVGSVADSFATFLKTNLDPKGSQQLVAFEVPVTFKMLK